jgi:hypothetical protein
MKTDYRLNARLITLDGDMIALSASNASEDSYAVLDASAARSLAIRLLQLAEAAEKNLSA